MKVTALLCDFAQVRDSLLFVNGGGITRLWRTSYPAPMNVSLALVFEVHQMELPHPHQVSIRVMGPDGQQIAFVEGAFNTSPSSSLEIGEHLVAPLALDLRNVALPVQGEYSIEIAVDGTHQETLQFWCQPRPDAKT